jgi:hypothetical protein
VIPSGSCPQVMSFLRRDGPSFRWVACSGVAAHGWNIDYWAGFWVVTLVLSDSFGVERGYHGLVVGLGTLLGPEGAGPAPGFS